MTENTTEGTDSLGKIAHIIEESFFHSDRGLDGVDQDDEGWVDFGDDIPDEKVQST